MKVRRTGKNVLIFALVLVMGISQTLTATAASAKIGDGVVSTCDEAYYATTDYYGNLLEGSVVKSYVVNGKNSIVDYGNYDEVVNLTDGNNPKIAGDKVTFNFGKKVPTHFYFEGKTTKPFEQLPWTMEIHYKLNGVPTKAEDLAGKTGMVDIDLDFIPNPNASEYALNNYVLAATAVFNQDDILSLEAEGAQVQLVGNLRLVLFMVLPGEEQHFTISVGAESFEFGGMTYLMMPATLAQLQEISKISQHKDDIEENYDLLNESLDTLLDSVDDMSSSLYKTADGLDELNEGRNIISGSRDSLYDKSGKTISDLDRLRGSLNKYPAHIEKAQEATSKASIAFTNLSSSLKGIQKSLDEMYKDMNDLKKATKNAGTHAGKAGTSLSNVGTALDKVKEDQDNLVPLLADLQLKIGGSPITMNPGGAGDMDLPALETAMNSMTKEQKSALNKARKGYTMFEKEDDAVSGLAESEFIKAAIYTSGKTYSEAVETYNTVTALDTAVAGLMAAHGYSQDEARAAVYAAQNMSAAQQAAYEAGSASVAGLKTLYANFKDLDGADSVCNEVEFLSAMVYQAAATAGSPVIPAEAKRSAVLFILYGNTTNLSSALDALGSSGVAGDTASLLKETSTVLKQLADITDSIQDITDDSSDVIERVGDLSDVFKNYTPDLNATLGELNTTLKILEDAAGDTHDFLSTFRDVMHEAGGKLDDGTKKTLEGLSAALRDTARSVSKTTNVKRAKNNISDIVEDMWDDYTGDINRLLMMDPTADAESLTDARNATPTSVQVMIRSAEIKVPDIDSDAPDKTKEKTTFFGRVAQMFKDLFGFIAGIFS